MMAVGAGISIFGDIKGRFEEAEAAKENASWLDEQAAFAERSTQRSLDISQRESSIKIGNQIGGFAVMGVELAGGALAAINDSREAAESEIAAIKDQGHMQAKEAHLKAGAARDRADAATDPFNILLSTAGSAASAYGQYKYMSAGKGKID